MKCTSNGLQWIKHSIAGLQAILMLVTATFSATWAAGISPWWYPVVIGSIAIIMQRIVSEITFWQDKLIVKERLEKMQLSTDNNLSKEIKEIKDMLHELITNKKGGELK